MAGRNLIGERVIGYTHYWTRSNFTISKDDWKQITADVAKIVAKSPAPLCYEYDEPARPPCVSDTLIRFNGKAEAGHETFYIERAVPAALRKPRYQGDNPKWTFCKTAQKPYDVPVSAVLAYLDSCWPKLFTVTSDGGADDWAYGVALACEALPERQITAPRSVLQEERV